MQPRSSNQPNPTKRFPALPFPLATALCFGNGPFAFHYPLLFVIPSVGWALGPPKVMKNFTGNYFLWSRFHFLVIPTGAKRRDLRFRRLSVGMFFDGAQRGICSS